jgi:hypothetical protein
MQNKYIVTSNTTGTRYLVERKTGRKAYRWAKRSASTAHVFASANAARKAASRYEGTVAQVG